MPTDREGLLRAADELEIRAAQPVLPGQQDAARGHAIALFMLAEVRYRLGEKPEAERLVEQAAEYVVKDGKELSQRVAAGMRIRQASWLLNDGHARRALDVVERMIEEHGGFPKVEVIPVTDAAGIELWLVLVKYVGDSERLYAATAVAMERLRSDGPSEERGVLRRAIAMRAATAQALGHLDEAAELYQRAIALFEREEFEADREYHDHAVTAVAPLLYDLGRKDEAAAAYRRIIDRLDDIKSLRARAQVITARAWLRSARR
jgi:tetratricopeptide (TPR) repeat protein